MLKKIDKKIWIEFFIIMLVAISYILLLVFEEIKIIQKDFMSNVLIILIPSIYLCGSLLVRGILEKEKEEVKKENEELRIYMKGLEEQNKIYDEVLNYEED